MLGVLRNAALVGAAATLVLAGCSSEETDTAPPDAGPCAELEIHMPDGSCLRPGVPADGCAAGFSHDGSYGCAPILPADPCPPGQMAVPGDEACRPVAPCAEGTWGDIAVDGTTQHVNGAHVGTSDGSAEQPWTTIGEAVAAAPVGGLVAIAAGSYVENIRLEDKPVRLWGVCPDLVAISGAGYDTAVISIRAGADGSLVRGVALTGADHGVWLSGSQDVELESVWLHETTGRGVVADNSIGASSITIRSSLIELAVDVGAFIEGASVTMEDSVVRDTAPRPSTGILGRGINVQVECDPTGCNAAAPAHAVIRRSVVLRNHDVGIFLAGADGTIEGSVVRGTLPEQQSRLSGRGLSVQNCDAAAGCDPQLQSSLELRTSVVDQNYDMGIAIAGALVSIESTAVRGTLPQPADAKSGRGLGINSCGPEMGCDPIIRADVTLTSSLVEQNHEHGIYLAGSDLTLRSTVIRDTLPRALDGTMGRGLNAQYSCPVTLGCDPSRTSIVHAEGSLFERNHDINVMVLGSTATLTDTVIRDTAARASDSLFGDGLAVFAQRTSADASLTNCRIGSSARAGISNFGGAVSLESTAIRCAAFALAGETHEGTDASYEDRGQNQCGCPEADGSCQVISANLEPPDPVGD